MKTTTLKSMGAKLLLVALVSAIAITTGGCAGLNNAEAAGRTSKGLVNTNGIDGQQPPNAKTIYATARLWRSQGSDKHAESALHTIIRDFPEFSPAYNELADICMAQGRFNDAAHYLRQGLEIAPNDTVLLNNAGVCALLQSEFDQSYAYFQQAYNRAPDESRYLANVALATGMTGNEALARELYEQVVSKEDAKHNIDIIQRMLMASAIEPELVLQLLEPIELDTMLD